MPFFCGVLSYKVKKSLELKRRAESVLPNGRLLAFCTPQKSSVLIVNSSQVQFFVFCSSANFYIATILSITSGPSIEALPSVVLRYFIFLISVCLFCLGSAGGNREH